MPKLNRPLVLICLTASLLIVSLRFSSANPLTIIGADRSSETKQSQETPAATQDRNQEHDLKPDMGKIDMAGKQVGEKIEEYGGKATGFFGSWINSKLYAGISWLKLLVCLVLIFIVLAFEQIVRWVILRKIDTIPKIEGKISWTRLVLKALVQPLSLWIWVYGIYGAISPLFSHFQTDKGENLVHVVFQKIASGGGIIALFWFLYHFINILDARLIQWAKTTESTIDDMLVPLFAKTLRIFTVILGSIIVMQTFTGLEIGPLLASLGIGGLAVALAAKDTIANFFGTLTILFDKPFQVGERVIIENYDGVIENVGFRSTRIRLLTGHLVTIPNERVVNSSLENIGKRPNIRWLTNIGITYDTPPEKIEQAVNIIREIMAEHEGIHPDFPPRVYFNGFNESSLNIMVIAWYHPPDYWNFQEWIQRTCLEITRRFNLEGIDFAFPTRTLHLANDGKRQLKIELLNQQERAI